MAFISVRENLAQREKSVGGCGTGVPVVCVIGFSNSGKTTLTVGLVKALIRRGIRVATIKHDVHGFEMDRPGKDSWRHKQAGAVATIISSPNQVGMVMDVSHDHHPLELLRLLPEIDIVLAEGFKQAGLPKIEAYRPENGKPPACRGDRRLIAVAGSQPVDWGVPWFGLDDVEGLADLIIENFLPAKAVPNVPLSSAAESGRRPERSAAAI